MSPVVHLNELRVKDGEHRYDINKHAYYQALETQTRELYENQIHKSSCQSHKPTAAWENFLALRDSIKETGYHPPDNERIILKKERNIGWTCYHGRHRICILLHLYGSDASLKLKSTHYHNEYYVVEVKSDEVKTKTT